MSTIPQWIAAGKHLPRFLRDFHDQKDLFKTIERQTGRDNPPYGIDWIQAQIYVIDRFLRFMAFHGYTLQRTRKRGEFVDLDATLREAEEERGQQFANAVKERLSKRITKAAPEGAEG